ncbi:MAG: hypothetical protein OEW02_02445 [Myxococcales bacterium]|nr:hypothetical protein [Myxococcales bacterium]MDH5566097.1 hypothetical protein [Myxococcales bacterium]
MPEKLGEMLVRNGLIGEEQLESALEAQLVFGGRLGTNLIELGFIGASTLAEFLARRLHLPALDPQGLESIEADAIARLPPGVAAKLCALPLRFEGRSLRIAMVDPTDLNAIDELAFVTGCPVTPVVAPELLLIYGLEKYYGVTRKTRFIRLAAGESSRGRSAGSLPAAPFAGNAPHSPRPHAGDASPYELADALKELAEVRRPPAILKVVLRFLRCRFQRVAILAVQDGKARGWSQLGCMPPPETGDADPFHEIDFSESSSPLLSRALCSDAPFLAPQNDEPGDSVDPLAALLWKAGAADPILLIPIRYGERTVAVALARCEREAGALAAREAYELLAARATLALDLIRLRGRILHL